MNDVSSVPSPSAGVSRLRILHIITDLNPGGAEAMLLKLISRMDRDRFQNTVIALGRGGVVGERLEALGVPVRYLGARPATIPLRFMTLVRWIRAAGPDLVQTWMHHADVIGGLASRIACTNVPVVWNLRASRLDMGGIKLRTRAVARVGGWLSGWLPERVIAGSHAALSSHASLGYVDGRMTVIPNGFDLTEYAPDPTARREIRLALGVASDTMTVGLIARFHPLKDHGNFLRAAAIVAEQEANVHFILCGQGMEEGNPALLEHIRAARLGSRLHLLGRRDDVRRVAAALDVGCLSSFSEGFPNVIGEMMACGVPVVATDAGDARRIIDTTGVIVPVRDPEALAAGLLRVLRMTPHERRLLGERARARIESTFSLRQIVSRYESLYQEVTARRRSGLRPGIRE